MTPSASPEASTSYTLPSAAYRPTPVYPPDNGQAPWSASHRDVRSAPDVSFGRTPSPDVHRRDQDRALTAPNPRNPLHPTLPHPASRLNPPPPNTPVISPFRDRLPHHIQHGRLPSLLSAPSPARNGHNHRPLESPRPSSFPPTSHHETLSTHPARPRTSNQVFHNISDLAAHHGIPIALPPLPRTAPRSNPAPDFAQPVEPIPTETSTSPDLNFTDLCSNYLTMLSQNNEEHVPATVAESIPATVSHDDEAAVKALMDALQGQRRPVLPLTHWLLIPLRTASPEFTMAQDHADFLSSPQYLTSPFESPYDDFLATPGMGAELDFSPDILTSPMMEYDSSGYGDMPLFPDMQLFDDMPAQSSFKAPPPPKVMVSPPDFAGLYTMPSPATPSLDPSSLNTSPALIDASMFPAPSASPAAAPSRRKNAPTGTRKNVTPDTLIPLDAPIQPRKYVTPSATSRKEVPATFARKRARSQAFPEDDDEETIPDLPPDATEEEQIKNKRLQNTLAARRSRKRKLEHQKQLEDENDGLRASRDGWRSHTQALEELLRGHGIDPPAVDPALLQS